ncbi:uncharacterized protein LOC106469178 [Limulus polyphemus]|uniref:Uncharacterized protein LOC106469178 n=1 Tax=Limulus polyphemus TaxID=6850 RepID=A0ABM1BMP4_LIMPO|nr:uncharacterized protein LOC106469178 [Limulus polyphemus]
MDNKFLLFAFIFLVCCHGSSGFLGWNLVLEQQLFNALICNENVNNGTRVARYECVLNAKSEDVRNAKQLCQNQTAPGLTDLEFLNQLCTNATARVEFTTCVKNELIPTQNQFPFFSIFQWLRINRRNFNCGVNFSTFLTCLTHNILPLNSHVT